MGILCVFCVYDTIGNRCFEKTSFPKIVGTCRRVNQKDKIRGYIKARSKLVCSLKQLMTELSTTYGPSCVSYDTIRRWKIKFNLA